MKYCLLLVVFVCTFQNSNAQSDKKTDTLQFLRYGTFLNGGIDLHHANFAKFNDRAFCCPDNFSDKQSQLGFGMAIGGLLEFPLSSVNPNWFWDIRLGMQFHSGTLTQQHETIFNNNLSGNQGVKGAFDYSISSKIAGVFVSLMPSYHLTYRLSAHAGLQSSYLFYSSYNQSENVVSPSNAYFYNDSTGKLSKQRNNSSGDIPGLHSFQLSGIAGLSYEIAGNLNGSTLITPEVFYTIGITQLSGALKDNGSWRRSGFYAGISLKYSPTPTVFAENKCPECYIANLEANDCLPELICKDDQQLKLNAITKKCECISTVTYAEIDSVIGKFSNGEVKKFPELEITVQQFRKTIMKPILPYLFYFSSASDISDVYSFIDPTLRDQYKIEKTVERLKSKPLALYNDILNIVGKRLTETPDAILTIAGYHDGVESNGKDIAADRALIVKKYLQDTWKIPDERFVIVSGDLPTNPATINGSTTDEKARQENRRVELSSNNPAIFAPISTIDIDREVAPESISYFSTVKSPYKLTGGYFEVKQSADGKNSQLYIKKENFADAVPIRFDISWKNISAVPLSQGDIYYDFVVSNAKGVIPRSATTLNLKVKQVTPEEKERARKPDKFSQIYDIILYDINSTGLTPANNAMIEEVKKNITANSKVRVIGFTDNIGTKEYNQQLAQKRAEGIASLLPKESVVEVRGEGISNQYSNESPEGRNYNRAVRIIIETDNRK